MTFLTAVIGFAAPAFIILSPVLSYGDQALSMHKARSSAGFSLDIPLIMLVASFFRIFYWPGARFDDSLLVQSLLMVLMQVILLKIGLDHRPSPASRGGEGSKPFSNVSANRGGILDMLSEIERPYGFWQWRSPKPYWQFLAYLLLGLCVMQLIMAPIHSIYPTYSNMIGIVGLSVEATLPLPQMLANVQTRSCKGFRPSVLASWLIGDAMKMFWFFTATTEIPLAFKVCGIFQASCDCFLGFQYFMYETPYYARLAQQLGLQLGQQAYIPMEERNGWSDGSYKPTMQHAPAMGHSPQRSLTPTRRPAFNGTAESE